MPSVLPLEDFARLPDRTSAELSPDGTVLAFRAPRNDRLNLWVQPVDGGDAVPLTDERHRGVAAFWFVPGSAAMLYTRDVGGDEDFHLFKVDRDDPDAPPVDLTPFDGVTCQGVHLPGGMPGAVVAVLNRRDPALLEPWAIDIATGDMRLLAENPGHGMVWTCDGGGRLFLAAQRPGGDWEVLAHDAATASYRLSTTYEGEDAHHLLSPFVATPDGSGIWLGSSRGSTTLQLVRLDVETGTEEVLAADPEVDLPSFMVAERVTAPMIVSARTGALLGARFAHDRITIRVLHPDLEPVLALASGLCDGDLVGLSSDAAERRWLATFTTDRDRPATYLLDVDTGSARLLFRESPWIDPDQLAPMTPVRIPTRDGLRMQGYLTLPVGVDPTGLPLVLLVHGGPMHRDCWGFDPNVQFLANRGHAVLQVNFRGSTGFGTAFTRASHRQFAGTMHDDLIDAADWAIDAGIADPDRVGIMGGSYGGYAALAAITVTPDRFAAAVDICGIADLAAFVRALPAYWRNTMAGWHQLVGDPDVPEDAADMLARSPISHVDRIVTPLLVVQGANDARVRQAESDTIVEALRTRGLPVRYLLKDDEGHGFHNPENVREMLAEIESFLDEHLRPAAG